LLFSLLNSLVSHSGEWRCKTNILTDAEMFPKVCKDIDIFSTGMSPPPPELVMSICLSHHLHLQVSLYKGAWGGGAIAHRESISTCCVRVGGRGASTPRLPLTGSALLQFLPRFLIIVTVLEPPLPPEPSQAKI
jgi:hypothetical protein